MAIMSIYTSIFVFISTAFLLNRDVCGEMVSMKIVDEPSSYGLSNNFGGLYQSQEEKLTMRVRPANFSGPAHLKRLVGKCFNMVDDNYKYEFCPFSNVTQHEQSLRWNPYSGVLGVYQEWQIENNTFQALVMREGDACGDIFRSVKVFFKCGNKSQITEVSEPHTCQYHMNFLTPLVCHPHAMLVFPTLSKQLQREWDHLEGELVRDEITKQGYNKKLNKIFEKAGYHLSSEDKKRLTKPPEKEKEEPVKTEIKGESESMSKCEEEVKKLKEENEQLREALITHGIKKFQQENAVAPDPEHQTTRNHGDNDVQNIPVTHDHTPLS